MIKKILLLVVFLLISTITIYAAAAPKVLPSQLGIVQSVKYVDINDDNYAQTKQIAEVKLLKGDLKGTLINIENIFTGNPHYDINLQKGMKIILHVEDEGDGLSMSVEDVYRSNTLMWLSVLFIFLLIFVGHKKGLYSLLAIVITCLMIFYLLSPMILAGINAILATSLICILSTAITMYIVGGFNKKSTSATLGCLLSILFATITAFISTKCAHLNGFGTENMMYLYSSHPELNFVNIIISSMLLATLGATMDVAMSISSTINEIYTLDISKTFKELFKSGMNVGKDIIGTMANTLILVYLGGSIPLLLLASNIDFQKFINLNQVVTELASALIGSSAVVICVPLTALVAASFVPLKKENKVEIEAIIYNNEE